MSFVSYILGSVLSDIINANPYTGPANRINHATGPEGKEIYFGEIAGEPVELIETPVIHTPLYTSAERHTTIIVRKR